MHTSPYDYQPSPLIEQQAKIFKALGHPSRLVMVNALRAGTQCVCELQALVGADMSTVSKHLSVLREAGIVTSQKKGTSIYYSLALPCLDTFLQCTGSLVQSHSLLPKAMPPHAD